MFLKTGSFFSAFAMDSHVFGFLFSETFLCLVAIGSHGRFFYCDFEC